MMCNDYMLSRIKLKLLEELDRREMLKVSAFYVLQRRLACWPVFGSQNLKIIMIMDGIMGYVQNTITCNRLAENVLKCIIPRLAPPTAQPVFRS